MEMELEMEMVVSVDGKRHESALSTLHHHSSIMTIFSCLAVPS